MERGERGRGFGDAGGIASLAEIIEEHGKALNYDLMTSTRWTLADVGGELPWSALSAFVAYLPPGSALARSTGDDATWTRDQMLLALICDELAVANWLTVCRGQKKSKWPKRPKPIPRPGVEKQDEGKRIGKDPIPVSDFDKWYYGGDASGEH